MNFTAKLRKNVFVLAEKNINTCPVEFVNHRAKQGGSLFEGRSGEKERLSEAKALLLGYGLGAPPFASFFQ